jgi:hypothetical protein
LAEFSFPPAEGDQAGGRVTVSLAGGSVQANIDRWRQQFGGKPEKESQERITVAGVPVTLVDLSGTFNDQRGPFAPAVAHPGYRMMAAILDLEGQLAFVKAYAPAKTMAVHGQEFQKFVRSLSRSGPAS